MSYRRWVEFESISERLKRCYCYHTCLEECHQYATNEKGETIHRCLCYENNKKRLFPNLNGALERRWVLQRDYELSLAQNKRLYKMYQESKNRSEETKELLHEYRLDDFIEPEKLEQQL